MPLHQHHDPACTRRGGPGAPCRTNMQRPHNSPSSAWTPPPPRRPPASRKPPSISSPLCAAPLPTSPGLPRCVGAARANELCRDGLLQLGADDAVLFWRVDDPYGEFCQWFLSPICDGANSYCCAEQLMMAAKARLFQACPPAAASPSRRAGRASVACHHGDVRSQGHQAPRPRHPGVWRRRLAICRSVRRFVEAQWDAAKLEIVVRASVLKFSQSADLLAALRRTGTRRLVEASPLDRVWGIGLAPDDPRARHPAQWRGTNLLGTALTAARTVLVEGAPVRSRCLACACPCYASPDPLHLAPCTTCNHAAAAHPVPSSHYVDGAIVPEMLRFCSTVGCFGLQRDGSALCGLCAAEAAAPGTSPPQYTECTEVPRGRATCLQRRRGGRHPRVSSLGLCVFLRITWLFRRGNARGAASRAARRLLRRQRAPQLRGISPTHFAMQAAPSASHFLETFDDGRWQERLRASFVPAVRPPCPAGGSSPRPPRMAQTPTSPSTTASGPWRRSRAAPRWS